jgi:hypothetical protein
MSRVVNLYDLRRAIAALVWARHSVRGCQLVDRDQVALVDAAVALLAAIGSELRGDLAVAARSLLSQGPDPGGLRTVRAIDRLGDLAHVDAVSAPAIACLRPAELFESAPLRLFDPDTGVAS